MNNSNKTNQFKILPKELLDKGWILKSNELLIPYTYKNLDYSDDNEYYYSIEKIDKKYLISWKIKEPGSDIYSMSESYQTTKFINVSDGDRNRILGYKGSIGNLPRDKNTIKEFWDSLILPLNKYKVQTLLDENFEILKENEELEVGESDKYPYKVFEDYPKSIQEEAIEIIGSNNFFGELLRSISWKHEGDKKTAKLLLLSVATVYLKSPVHQILNAEKGEGKSDTFNRIKELQPDQYVVDLVSFSSKALFYGKEEILNNSYNLLFLDDIKFRNDIIELLKLILDNERKKKTHRTIVDGKYVEMELEGNFLGLINRAKEDLDMELADRCYLNSLEDNNPEAVKNKIKEKGIRNIDLLHKKNNLKLKCCYQYFIDKEIRVFNPMILFLNVKDHDNRNIIHYIELTKGMTFYNYNMRLTIDGITIGSFEDIKEVFDIVSKDFKTQKEKLTPTMSKIIKFFENNPNEVYTYRDLAKNINTSKQGIVNAIKGRDNQKGLEDLGYLMTEYIDESKSNYVGFLSEKTENDSKSLESDISLQTLYTFRMFVAKNPSFLKKAIILNFLEYKHILINKYIIKKINNFLENSKYKLESYDNQCKMIESFNKIIIDDKNIINISPDVYIENADLKFHNNILTKTNNVIFNFLSSNKERLFTPTKNEDEALNQKQTNNNYKHDKCIQVFTGETENGEYRIDIQKEIFEKLNYEAKTKRSKLIGKLPIYDKDPDTNYRLINQTINNLIKNKRISADSKEFLSINIFNKENINHIILNFLKKTNTAKFDNGSSLYGYIQDELDEKKYFNYDLTEEEINNLIELIFSSIQNLIDDGVIILENNEEIIISDKFNGQDGAVI